MNFTKYAKMAVIASAVMACFWTQPQSVQAEESSTRGGGGGVIIDFDIVDLAAVPSTSAATDDVWVDGKIITATNYDSAAASGDPEWRYVPVRRTATASTNSTEDDHDILYDPADDLLPPAKPVGDEEPTPAFDGRLLTAADLTTEP